MTPMNKQENGRAAYSRYLRELFSDVFNIDLMAVQIDLCSEAPRFIHCAKGDQSRCNRSYYSTPSEPGLSVHQALGRAHFG